MPTWSEYLEAWEDELRRGGDVDASWYVTAANGATDLPDDPGAELAALRARYGRTGPLPRSHPVE